MRRAFSSTEITWVAAMATVRMVLVFAFRVLEARGTASAVDPPRYDVSLAQYTRFVHSCEHETSVNL